MCVYYYHVIITFCYKVSDLRTKIVKLVTFLAFYQLCRYSVYYLCMDDYDCVG